MASRHPEGKNTNESEPQISEEIKISDNATFMQISRGSVSLIVLMGTVKGNFLQLQGQGKCKKNNHKINNFLNHTL